MSNRSEEEKRTRELELFQSLYLEKKKNELIGNLSHQEQIMLQ